MNCFVDTSAFFALMDADDQHHHVAKAIFCKAVEAQAVFITSNYVLVETLALLQRRIGMDAVRAFQTSLAPILQIEFVTVEHHRLGVAALLAASRRNLSLVDCVSFEMMRSLGLTSSFSFDSHFNEQGFACVAAD